LRFDTITTPDDWSTGYVKCDICGKYAGEGLYFEPETESEFELVRRKLENGSCGFVGICCRSHAWTTSQLIEALVALPDIKRRPEETMTAVTAYSKTVDKDLNEVVRARFLSKFRGKLREFKAQLVERIGTEACVYCEDEIRSNYMIRDSPDSVWHVNCWTECMAGVKFVY
jgi:hypothetical protein